MFVPEQKHLGKMFCTSAEGPTLHVSEHAEWFWKVVEYWSSMRCYEKSKNAKQCGTRILRRCVLLPVSGQCCSSALSRGDDTRWKTGPIGHQEELKITLPRWIWLFRVSLNQEQISKSFQVIEPSYSTTVFVEPLFVETWGPSGRDHSRAWISSSVSTRHGRLDNDDVVWTWLLHLMDLVGMSCFDWLDVNIEDDVKKYLCCRCVNN